MEDGLIDGWIDGLMDGWIDGRMDGLMDKIWNFLHADSCAHHPGVPVFHDAYKGWSCCKKKCTDFTEFLNIPVHNFKKSYSIPFLLNSNFYSGVHYITAQ